MVLYQVQHSRTHLQPLVCCACSYNVASAASCRQRRMSFLQGLIPWRSGGTGTFHDTEYHGSKIERQLPLPSAVLFSRFCSAFPRLSSNPTSPLLVTQSSQQPQRPIARIFPSHSGLKLSNFCSIKPLMNRALPGLSFSV